MRARSARTLKPIEHAHDQTYPNGAKTDIADYVKTEHRESDRKCDSPAANENQSGDQCALGPPRVESVDLLLGHIEASVVVAHRLIMSDCALEVPDHWRRDWLPMNLPHTSPDEFLDR